MYGDVGEHIENMTYEDWEDFGRDVSSNTYLEDLFLGEYVLNDPKMTSLFRGLTRSNSIKELNFPGNEFGVEGVRSMVPFLQRASNLKRMNFFSNSIGSEGFNTLFRALRDSPIEDLQCYGCGIELIEIDDDRVPLNLRELHLTNNFINTDGSRELSKLLQRGDSNLEELDLGNNNIDDECVAILVNALQNNTSLHRLWLQHNSLISNEGKGLLLKLVNDVSSIKATLQSNHTLRTIFVDKFDSDAEEIGKQINAATLINRTTKGNLDAGGRAKVIRTQLNSLRRAELADLQGVHRSVYSQINPLHLPEVLSIIGQAHGQGELYFALKSTMAALFSTSNRKERLLQQREYHAAKEAEHRVIKEELDAEIATIEESERSQNGNKRPRII